MINVHAQRALTAAVIAGAFTTAAWTGSALAQAEPAVQPFITVTVDGTDYPVCDVEDCSDQPGGIGVWFNGGRGYLELGPTITIPLT